MPLKCLVSVRLFHCSDGVGASPISNREYKTCLRFTILHWAASYWSPIIANHKEQTGKHQNWMLRTYSTVHTVTDMAAKTEKEKKKKLWQQNECLFSESCKTDHNRTNKEKAWAPYLFFYPSHASVRSRGCGITTVVSLRSVGRLVWCVHREDYTQLELAFCLWLRLDNRLLVGVPNTQVATYLSISVSEIQYIARRSFKQWIEQGGQFFWSSQSHTQHATCYPPKSQINQQMYLPKVSQTSKLGVLEPFSRSKADFKTASKVLEQLTISKSLFLNFALNLPPREMILFTNHCLWTKAAPTSPVMRSVVFQAILTLTWLTELLFTPRQIKFLSFHTRISVINKLNWKCNKTRHYNWSKC